MTTGLRIQPIGTTRDAKTLIEGTTIYQCFQKGYLTHSAKTERGRLSGYPKMAEGCIKTLYTPLNLKLSRTSIDNPTTNKPKR